MKHCENKQFVQSLHTARKLLAAGKKAVLSDVQKLIVDFMPDLTRERIRLVVRGGKKKLLTFPVSEEIDLQCLLDLNILTEDGAQAVCDEHHDIYKR